MSLSGSEMVSHVASFSFIFYFQRVRDVLFTQYNIFSDILKYFYRTIAVVAIQTQELMKKWYAVIVALTRYLNKILMHTVLSPLLGLKELRTRG